MRFRAECPHCRGILSLRDADAGREVRCPHCKKRLTAPPAPGTSIGEEKDRGPEARRPEPGASQPAGAPPDAAIQLFQEIEQEGQASGPEVSVRTADGRGLGLAPAPSAPPSSAPAGPTEGLVWPPLGEGFGSPRARRAPVPTVVSVYGIIIMVGMGLATVGIVIEALLQLPPILRSAGATGFYYLVIISAVWLGLTYFLYRIGKDMREGRRWAVVALCVICGVAALQAMLMWVVIGQSEVYARVAEIRVLIVVLASVVTLVVAGAFVPPLVSAFRHWEAFE